jgi:hypothetical protein
MKIRSPAFEDLGAIPRQYTCQGSDTSPELVFADVPSEAKSLALIVDDPDAPDPKAPKTTWVHWVVYNLPPHCRGLPEGVRSLPAGAREGTNDWKRVGWGGPCPPIGRHRYYFKLYALDVELPALANADKRGLEQAMLGHVVAEAVLMGTYQKG